MSRLITPRLMLIHARNVAIAVASGLDRRRMRLVAVYFAGFLSHALLSPLLSSDASQNDGRTDESPIGSSYASSSSLPPPFVPKTRYEVLRYDALDEKSLYNNVDDDPRIGLTRHHKADVADIVRRTVALLNEKEDDTYRRENLAKWATGKERKTGRRRKNLKFPKTWQQQRVRWKLKSYRRGWRRFDPTRGEEHKMLLDLSLTTVDGKSSNRRVFVTVVKPFADAVLVDARENIGGDERLNNVVIGPQDAGRETTRRPIVHFIVPVARLSSRFDDFIVNYEDVCLKKSAIDKKTNFDVVPTDGLGCALLLVVFDGPSNLDKDTVANVRSHLTRLKNLYGDKIFRSRLILTKDAFTRALGMDLAARELPKDALAFFVDVDVNFDANFVENCRLLTEKGKTVYYPIVFSQYDPAIVGNYSVIGGGRATSDKKSTSDKPLPLADISRTISKHTGHWVVYGFGMTCVYKSDYDAVGGYDLSIRGWGGEDVALFDSHVRHASIAVARACEPGLVHRYHERYCDPGLAEDRLRMCRGAAAESLGSRAQLANLVAEMRKSENGKRTVVG